MEPCGGALCDYVRPASHGLERCGSPLELVAERSWHRLCCHRCSQRTRSGFGPSGSGSACGERKHRCEDESEEKVRQACEEVDQEGLLVAD